MQNQISKAEALWY